MALRLAHVAHFAVGLVHQDQQIVHLHSIAE
jgi:hypothetical protein